MSCPFTILRRCRPGLADTTAVDLALGLWGLSRQYSVWRDEAATWQVGRRSVADIWLRRETRGARTES
ncbi:hypothetical protein WKI71_35755 [Streptomyces sp. MS1.AVA.1]|uniref:Uncharacterized protein n=1 Tax=Streptomyces machairae TaxID=3134109 RepID=A0ABU8US85_9ACTN